MSLKDVSMSDFLLVIKKTDFNPLVSSSLKQCIDNLVCANISAGLEI